MEQSPPPKHTLVLVRVPSPHVDPAQPDQGPHRERPKIIRLNNIQIKKIVFTYMLFRYNLHIRAKPQVTHLSILHQYIHVFCAFDRHRKFCCRLTKWTMGQRLRFKLGLTSQFMENEFNSNTGTILKYSIRTISAT